MHLKYPWRYYLAELIGTALLVLVGLSLVIVMLGTGRPVPLVVPIEGVSRLILDRCWGCWRQSSSAVSRQRKSRSPNCITSIAIRTGSFADKTERIRCVDDRQEIPA